MSAEHAVTQLSSDTLHASCVAIDGHAVLIEGPSGSGKSDLTLRLIDRGAVLVSDDYTLLLRRDGVLHASPPQTIRGQIEVRGIGIVELPFTQEAPVAAVIMIDPRPDRMPEPGSSRRIVGIDVPQFALPALEASAPLKVEIALHQLLESRA
ncbi:HPr kinase/phosphorylase [Sphingomonas sp. 37zxx]|uniref:HPr kinase/phosphorylase n=1 Tax=Sphingomonas sp. 37zxx TaxID=1550073 RepID=UPI00053C05E9|nr:HPr kinase/phosphatase C-terminal domain-containing protein [Sphingomonas sp. 37zxx]